MMLHDANVIIRYLTQDDPQKAQKCFELLQAAERDEVELNLALEHS